MQYLGFLLSEVSRSITQRRIADIQNLRAPKTKKQLRAILGTTGFCRQWIPAYSEITKYLTDLTRNTEPEPLKIKPEHREALTRLKEVILSAPVLGIPDYNKPFQLLVNETKGIVSGVLTQTLGHSYCSIGYYSCQLDPIAAGTVPCLRGGVAAAVSPKVSRSSFGMSFNSLLFTSNRCSNEEILHSNAFRPMNC